MTQPSAQAQEIAGLRQAVAAARKPAAATSAASAPLGAPAVSHAGKIDQTAVAFNVFAKLLQSDGIRAALYSVLRRSDYRFLGIFRFKDGMATSCVHIDRVNLSVTQADEVPDTATYCSFVRGTGAPFVTADASSDPRTADHPARNVILAYCGIPVMESDGTLIGTLCHYDVVPRDPEALDLELLLQVSSALAYAGVVPPYPERAPERAGPPETPD